MENPPLIEIGSHPAGSAISVAFDNPLDRAFDYSLPAEWVGRVVPGQRVEVPFGKGNRPTVGFCVAVPDRWRMPRLKTVLRVVDEQPLIDAGLFELANWIGEYYCCPIGRALAVMVPSAVRRQVGLARRTLIFLPPDSPTARLPGKQANVVELLRAAKAFDSDSAVEIDELAKQAGCTRAPVRSLVRKSAVRAVEQEYLPGQMPPPARLTDPGFALNDLQRAALDRLEPRIERGGFSATLLHGVTSSGKTEIYLRLIRRALAVGRSALVLIPEIALTTQAVDRYRRRLGGVAVIHSGLSDGQRYEVWRRIAAGEYRVVLGTMSAVFAPVGKLGLVIVDEEQESSFKYLKSPRYNARDVAIKRAQLLGIPAVLGSATPSLESWHNARHLNRYDYIELGRRVADMPMPKVRVADMRAESHARRGVHLLSRLMEQEIGAALSAKKQVLLLLNRRGYASYLFCQSCRYVQTCERCKANVIYHKSIDSGLCHQCGRKYSVPAECPACRCKLIRFGLGTQRVEEELARKFPDARYIRVDRDTMRHVRDYEDALGRFEAGQFDVMLGTQMIAKGLDFPNVALVGVVSADTTLSIPDFRSAERTFQLVSQVAGRAGRTGEPGRVVIQTFNAALPAIDYAVRHDYRGFAELELELRKSLGYPPFGRLALFVLRGPTRLKVASSADELAARLEQVRAKAELVGRIIGPSVAPVERIRGQWRYHLLLRTPSASVMRTWLADARRQGTLDIPVDWIVDVDPLALM